jgi:hypothetical protein
MIKPRCAGLTAEFRQAWRSCRLCRSLFPGATATWSHRHGASPGQLGDITPKILRTELQFATWLKREGLAHHATLDVSLSINARFAAETACKRRVRDGMQRAAVSRQR